ncbi:MAG: hypothetical protein H6Q64_1731, partial [Firmicutes bacterium]|nr:hypothetical protein [Bacillota bacterium]
MLFNRMNNIKINNLGRIFCVAFLAALLVIAFPGQQVWAESDTAVSGEVSGASTDSVASASDSQDTSAPNTSSDSTSSQVSTDTNNTDNTSADTTDNNDQTSSDNDISSQEPATENTTTDAIENTTDNTNENNQNMADDETASDDTTVTDDTVVDDTNNSNATDDEITGDSSSQNDATEENVSETPSNPEADEIVASMELSMQSQDIPRLSLQDIINAALTNDPAAKTVLIDGGVYDESLTFDGSIQPYLNDVSICASGNAGTPIVNGNIYMNGLNGFGFNGFQVNGDITVKDSNFVNITGTEQDDNMQVLLEGINSNIVLDGAGGNDTITTSGSPFNDSEKPEHGDRSPSPDVGPAITDVMIRGGTGDDRLVVDFDQGNPITGAGLGYDGGDGFDAIAIQGGSFANNIFTAYDPHSGSISLDGSMLFYQNIEPIEDSSDAENITFKGTDGNDSISIVNGTIVKGGDTFNAIEIQSPHFEKTIFANKKNVIVDGLGGDDMIGLNLTRCADALLSFTIRGGAGTDTISNSANNILLAGSDLILEAENIIISGGSISGNNISLISTTESGSSNPFADVLNTIDLDDTTITATGSLLLQATSKQLSPQIAVGILDIKKTWATITVTNSTLSATDISLRSIADLELLLNSLLLNLPVDPTVLVINTSAQTVVDGTSSLTSSTGDILLKAISNITTASVSKSKGSAGSLAFAVSVLDNTA